MNTSGERVSIPLNWERTLRIHLGEIYSHDIDVLMGYKIMIGVFPFII